MKKVREVSEVKSISENQPDSLFITCASFEERFLGVIKSSRRENFQKIILFKFSHPNKQREDNIKEMENTWYLHNDPDYLKINCEHGRSIEAILELNEKISKMLPDLSNATITIDITTFTKDLLTNIMLYFMEYKGIKRIRCLYTSPQKYASPEEGGLSYGIKSIHFPPLGWSDWSPLKNNLLILILGFEELRAWSLLERFPAQKKLVFITKPGTISEWDDYCEKYNRNLLKVYNYLGELPAIDCYETSKLLRQNMEISKINEEYNIFIAPLGTKPQLLAVIDSMLKGLPGNIVTTTVSKHNFPYYSSGIGNTFEFYFPFEEEGICNL